MEEIAKEIITADELNKYFAKRWIHSYEFFTNAVEEFSKMKENEKVIWGLSLNFDIPGHNMLLTNNGKLLYIIPSLNIFSQGHQNLCGRSKIVNHDFQIPPECIYSIKMLIKNISGCYQTQDNGGGMTQRPPRFHHTDFDAIYDNLNEYLNYFKTTIIKRNEQIVEMESIRLQTEKDTMLINLLDMPMEIEMPMENKKDNLLINLFD
jgi:hypothetical protein